MSLRFFHLFFITVAALMAFGCAWIEHANYSAGHAGLHFAGMLGGIVTGAGLLVYGGCFFKKSKKLVTR